MRSEHKIKEIKEERRAREHIVSGNGGGEEIGKRADKIKATKGRESDREKIIREGKQERR